MAWKCGKCEQKKQGIKTELPEHSRRCPKRGKRWKAQLQWFIKNQYGTAGWEKKLENLIEKILQEESWNRSCGGCPQGHSSFWKTIVTSPQWEAWEKEQEKRIGRGKNFKGVYDVSECRECGYISEEHFQEFLEFVVSRTISSKWRL